MLSHRSVENLRNVHPDLIAVIESVNFKHEIIVTEGARTLERQQKLLAEGKSRTLNSRHIPATSLGMDQPVGHAFDFAVVVDGTVTWEWSRYAEAAKAIKAAARRLGIEIEWGGDWTTFKDGTHIQLPWAAYPVVEGQKTPSKSKTVASAAVGLPIAAFLPDAFNALAEFTGYLSAISDDLVRWAQIAAVIAIAAFIIHERVSLNRREGV